MRNSSPVGLVAAPATGAPLRALLVAMLASAVALRRLEWWKLLERAGHLPRRRTQLMLHVAAIGLALSGADAAEEVAEEEETPLPSAMTHALLRVVLEASLFYTLLVIALACGLTNGENRDHENDVLAYLADAFVGGWGEGMVHALGCVLFITACEWVRARMIDIRGEREAGVATTREGEMITATRLPMLRTRPARAPARHTACP